MYKNKLLIVFGVTLLSGCVANDYSVKGTDSKAQVLSQTSFNDTRVFLLKSCPITQIPLASNKKESGAAIAAVAATIGPPLIEAGIDLIGSSLIAASGKDDETTTITAQTSDYFYKNVFNKEKKSFITAQNDSSKCIVFIEGSFGKTQKEGRWYPKSLGTSDEAKARWDFSQLIGPPKLYIEANMVVPDGRSEFKIIPRYVLYKEHLNSKGFDKERDILVNFEIETGLSKDKGSSSGFKLTKLTEGSYVESTQLNVKSTSFFPIPEKDTTFTARASKRTEYMSSAKEIIRLNTPQKVPESVKLTNDLILKKCVHNGTKRAKCEANQNFVTLQKEIDRQKLIESQEALGKKINQEISKGPIYGTPFTLKVSVTETRDINKFMLAVGNAFSTKKSELTTIVADRIIPSRKEAIENSAQTKVDAATVAFVQAQYDAWFANLELKKALQAGDPDDIASKEVALFKKNMDAHNKSKPAGGTHPKPIPPILPIL